MSGHIQVRAIASFRPALRRTARFVAVPGSERSNERTCRRRADAADLSSRLRARIAVDVAAFAFAFAALLAFRDADDVALLVVATLTASLADVPASLVLFTVERFLNVERSQQNEARDETKQ